jgi:hypothetical protein
VRLAVIVDEGDHGLNRRSSSARACVDAPVDASCFSNSPNVRSSAVMCQA